jgi:hypothetical protein
MLSAANSRLEEKSSMIAKSTAKAYRFQRQSTISLPEFAWMSHVAPLPIPHFLDGHHSTSNFRRSLNVGSSASIFIGKEKSGFEDTIQRSA